MKVPTHGEGIDLYKNQAWKRKYIINGANGGVNGTNGKGYRIEFSETKEDFDEVTQYLTANNGM